MFLLCKVKPEAPDLILASKPTEIESMPESYGAEFPISLLTIVPWPELPPISPLPRLPDSLDYFSEAPPSLLENIY
jgi:hypothetical protein